VGASDFPLLSAVLGLSTCASFEFELGVGALAGPLGLLSV
jgi:hypothetical protein